MQNEEGVITELYIPRKCSATNRLITSKDHTSVQINVGHLDENGIYTGQFSTFALCGYVRAQGDADSGLDRLWQKKKPEVKTTLGRENCCSWVWKCLISELIYIMLSNFLSIRIVRCN
ncbi:hypothetical protein CerSpe_206150 [Prunus speciosa]